MNKRLDFSTFNQVSPVNIHDGNSCTIMADLYPTLLDVILESVQNSLDESARNIGITIDLRERSITITDDGNGKTLKQFENALDNIVRSIKSSEKLGHFGIGLISPLGKCRAFFFTSTSRSNQSGYNCWGFDCEKIAKSKSFDSVPRKEVPELEYGRTGGKKTTVPWRTQVELVDITADKTIGEDLKIETLSNAILDRFNEAMRRNDCVANIRLIKPDSSEQKKTVEARQFQGEPLKKYELNHAQAGFVVFKLYRSLAQGSKRNGKISFGIVNRDDRITARQFTTANLGRLNSEVVGALLSGVFEGEILAEKVEFQASRRSFRTNDALAGLCDALDSWYVEVACDILDQVKEDRSGFRYQELGSRSMQVVASFLQRPENAKLLEDLKSTIKVGNIGSGHHGYDHDKSTGSTVKAITPKTKAPGLKIVDTDNSGKEINSSPDKDHPGHNPWTVAGPKGKKRLMVKSDSIGLQLCFSELTNYNKVYEFDLEYGVIHLNLRHPLFVMCDEKGDTALNRFIDHVTVWALLHYNLPEEYRQYNDLFFDDWIKAEVHLICNSDKISSRVVGKKKKSK